MRKVSFRTAGIAGVAFTFLTGCLLHFFYDLSGGHILAVLFGAVNESVWEHIKLFIAPYVVWSVFELCCLTPSFKPYVVGRVVGLYVFPVGIITLYYSYTAVLGTHLLWLDILISLFVCILAQLISYRVYLCGNLAAKWFPLAIAGLVLMGVMYFTFTAVPPRVELFRDPVSGSYGIPNSGYSAGQGGVQNAILI